MHQDSQVAAIAAIFDTRLIKRRFGQVFAIAELANESMEMPLDCGPLFTPGILVSRKESQKHTNPPSGQKWDSAIIVEHHLPFNFSNRSEKVMKNLILLE
jgi:hypothetical protein